MRWAGLVERMEAIRNMYRIKLKRLDIDWRIILKLILKKNDTTVSSGWLCKHGN
jgi:hypothetical protein